MNQTYLNCPSTGGAMSAEEYAAAFGPDCHNRDRDCEHDYERNRDHTCGQNCGCGRDSRSTNDDSCCNSRIICCCQEVSLPAPSPTVQEGCCCKQALRAALQLLCDPEISELLDFDLTAFITDHYIAGAPVVETVAPAGPADNLPSPLAGVFRRFSPCSLDLLDITAPLFTAPATATGLTATQVNLCELVAVVIQLAAVDAEGDLTAEQVAQRNLRRVRRLLSRQLNPCGSNCAGCSCTCPVGEDCCCSAGLLSTLSENNLSRRVSLAAGPLLLNGVTLVGNVGNVLVLVNEADQRFYFVCVNHIEFIA